MKNLYPNFSKTCPAVRILLVAFFTVFVANTNVSAQQELVFANSTLQSGTAGANGAIYKFPAVTSTMDALVKITGRSSSLVTLSHIDLPGQGFAKAFQPQIKFGNGSTSSSATWWMEFEISFVNKNTSTPAIVNSIKATGLDIDGDNNRLKEYQTFYSLNSFTLESSTQLVPVSVTGTISQLLQSGKQFTGAIVEHGGIDTSATELMTTVSYTNVSKITMRMGGITTGSANNTNRMYSVWFKDFNYNAPVVTLPVKLSSFTAMLLNNTSKVELKWSTSMEKDASHFMIERSTDGTNFTDAGMVFAFGNSDANKNYSFTDNISSLDAKVIYYRLRSVDADGSFEYSATRIIRTAKQAENTISILTYPNPVTNELRITIPNNWQGKKVTYEVIGANGITSKKVETGSSSQTETINVSSLATGFYVVRASCNGEIAQQKIVKK